MTVTRPRTEAPRRRPPTPRLGRVGTRGGRAAFLGTGPAAWYDTRDLLTTTQQTLVSRVGTGSATRGSTGGSDTNDPTALPHSGTDYVYLPSTASNNLSIPKDGGWAATLHVTGTLTDDTTATFTTTASPILIGNTLIAAGRYRKFVVRDTDENGTVRVTIEPAVETVGQASWTCTTGQTVTVNRSATGLTTAVVTRPLLMIDGTDDYLQLPAGDTPTFTKAVGAYTILVVYRRHITPGASDELYDFRSGANDGLFMLMNTSGAGTFTVRGTSSVSISHGTNLGNGTIQAVGTTFDNGTMTAYTNTAGLSSGSSYAGLTTDPVFAAGRIGSAAYAVTNISESEIFAVVRWTRALTETELNTAATYLLGMYT